MNNFFITLIIGVIVGIIDILPMIKMKIDKHSILSAFVFYLITPFVIYNTTLFNNNWWLKGALMNAILALPIMILVAKTDKRSVPIIFIMSIILGSVIGALGYFFIK